MNSAFLHKHAKVIAAVIAGLIAAMSALGWWDAAHAVLVALSAFGLGYLIPSPIAQPVSPTRSSADDPDPGDADQARGPGLLPFLFAGILVGALPHAAPAQAPAPARVTPTSLFGIAERNQMLQQHHDRLLALEAAARNQQTAPAQPAGPQVHYHYWQGGPQQQAAPAQPQILVLPQSGQSAPVPGIKQELPIAGTPQQQLPIAGQPLQTLPIPGTPHQLLVVPGDPKQLLLLQGQPHQVLPVAPPGGSGGQPRQLLPGAAPIAGDQAAPPSRQMPPADTAPAAPRQALPTAPGQPTGYQTYTRQHVTHALAKPVR